MTTNLNGRAAEDNASLNVERVKRLEGQVVRVLETVPFVAEQESDGTVGQVRRQRSQGFV